jgi:hypothetical protein
MILLYFVLYCTVLAVCYVCLVLYSHTRSSTTPRSLVVSTWSFVVVDDASLLLMSDFVLVDIV